MAEQNKIGRPLKFDSAEQLQKQIDDYFRSCTKEVVERDGEGNITDTYEVQTRPYTITGLALSLDTSRKVLLEYEDKDEFSNTIKRAKLRIENFAEESLFTSKQTAGVIFNMVNNYGWKNKQEHEQNVKHSFEETLDDL